MAITQFGPSRFETPLQLFEFLTQDVYRQATESRPAHPLRSAIKAHMETQPEAKINRLRDYLTRMGTERLSQCFRLADEAPNRPERKAIHAKLGEELFSDGLRKSFGLIQMALTDKSNMAVITNSQRTITRLTPHRAVAQLATNIRLYRQHFVTASYEAGESRPATLEAFESALDYFERVILRECQEKLSAIFANGDDKRSRIHAFHNAILSQAIPAIGEEWALESQRTTRYTGRERTPTEGWAGNLGYEGLVPRAEHLDGQTLH